MINFCVTKPDSQLIQRIAVRAAEKGLSLMETDMDITACHANGCPLRLKELAEADDSNFMHDVLGIREAIDRETGKLTGFFLPRFAAKQ